MRAREEAIRAEKKAQKKAQKEQAQVQLAKEAVDGDMMQMMGFSGFGSSKR